MVRAYYNPTQDQDIKESKSEQIGALYEAANGGLGFIRMRCKACKYRDAPENGDDACPFYSMRLLDDWSCARFEPIEKKPDQSDEGLGHWIKKKKMERMYRYCCSICDAEIMTRHYPYCPWCGSKMDV